MINKIRLIKSYFHQRFSHSLKKTNSSILTLFLLIIFSGNIHSRQSIRPTDFKSTFIFHLLENVEWKEENSFKTYQVGIVGNNQQLLQKLRQSAKLNLVNNKKVEIKNVSNLNEMKKFHLLFITSNKDPILPNISSATSRTNTLLVTENTFYKTNTMINLLADQDHGYLFEVNKANLTFEHLDINNDILLLGGTEMDVAELFKKSEDQLAILKEDLEKQRKELAKSKHLMLLYQEQYKNSVNESVRIKQQVKEQAILLQEKEKKLSAIKLELKSAENLLNSNEAILGEKLDAIANKEKQVTSLSDLINKNQRILEAQKKSIEDQKLKLESQKKALEKQVYQIEQQQHWLILGSFILLIISVFLAVIVHLNKARKKTNYELLNKNIALNEAQKALLIARDQAQTANDAKSSFLANMSHEIRTPMNAIIGMLHLTKKTNLDDKQGDYIRKMDNAANSLLEIINDILDFSKVEAGELKMEKIEFSLSRVLDNLANLTGLKIQEKGLEFIYDIDPNIPEKLIGDPLRLSQVLVNLTNNAMKFTEQGHVKVKISTSHVENHQIKLQFQVIDSGIGMTKEILNRLFKPFSQADTSTTRKFGGTGLGLAICKRLVESMGGTIAVSSSPKKGSVFTFNTTFSFERSFSILDRMEKHLPLSKQHIITFINSEQNKDAIESILNSFGCPTSSINSLENFNALIKSSNEKNLLSNHLLIDYKIACHYKDELLQLKRQVKFKIILLSSGIFERDENFIQTISPDIIINKPITPSCMLDGLMTLSGLKNSISISNRLAKYSENEKLKKLSNSLKNADILIVEDNEINQEVAKEILTQSVHSITLANNGLEAVELILKNQYDCVLMDIQMPIMDGYEATDNIRKTFNTEELPIVAMTANALGGDKEKCLAAGMNDYISKPIRVTELLETLNRWVNLGDQKTETQTIHENSFTKKLDDNLTLIDLSSGIELMGGESEFYQLLEKFQKQQFNFIERCKNLLLENDLYSIGEEAHNLKGVSANLFINQLPTLAEELTQACRQKKLASVIEQLPQLEKTLQSVLHQIQQLPSKTT